MVQVYFAQPDLCLIFNMKFESDRKIAFVVALITGFLGLSNLMMAIAIPDKEPKIFLGLAAAALLIVSAVAFGWKKVVKINKQQGFVEQSKQIYSWGKTTLHQLVEFKAVGIISASRSNTQGVNLVTYYVQLIGRNKNLTLPGSNTNLQAVQNEGKK